MRGALRKVGAVESTVQSAEHLKPCIAMLPKTSYAAAASAMMISDSSVTDSVLSLFEAGANGGDTERTGSDGETKCIRDLAFSMDKRLMIYWPTCSLPKIDLLPSHL